MTAEIGFENELCIDLSFRQKLVYHMNKFAFPNNYPWLAFSEDMMAFVEQPVLRLILARICSIHSLNKYNHKLLLLILIFCRLAL